MGGPKLTVIGAGSYFFGKAVIHKMATSAVMAGGTLALVDTNAATLRTMTALAKRVRSPREAWLKAYQSGSVRVPSRRSANAFRPCPFVRSARSS